MKKSKESCGKLFRERVGVCAWWLASAWFVLERSLPLLLLDGWESFHGLLSDNCSLLIYNVKLNVSLCPASSPPLQAESTVMQAATLALTGWEKCQNGCRMLHPHDLKYKSILGRLLSHTCARAYMHIHTHIHVLSLLSHSSLLTATGTQCKHLASNQPTCYNEIHCTLNWLKNKMINMHDHSLFIFNMNLLK